MKTQRLILLMSTFLNGCYAYSSFQSAATVERGRIEAIASYSSNSFSSDGESETMGSTLEAQVRTGISDRTDIGFRYAYPDLDRTDQDYSLISLEPKWMLVPQRFSLIMPLSMYFGESVNEDESIHVSPGFIFTHRFNDFLEATTSARYQMFLSDSDNLIAWNIGAGLSSDLDKEPCVRRSAFSSIRVRTGTTSNMVSDSSSSHRPVAIAMNMP